MDREFVNDMLNSLDEIRRTTPSAEIATITQAIEAIYEVALEQIESKENLVSTISKLVHEYDEIGG